MLALCHLDRAALGDATQRAIAHETSAAMARATGHAVPAFDYTALFAKLTPQGRRLLLHSAPLDVLETAAQCWTARAQGFVMRVARAGMYGAMRAEDRQALADRISQAQVTLKTADARSALAAGAA